MKAILAPARQKEKRAKGPYEKLSFFFPSSASPTGEAEENKCKKPLKSYLYLKHLQNMPKDILDIHHPHDSLFKKAFKNKAVAKDFLKSRLSKQLLKKIKLDTLKIENSSFISEKLRKTHSDLVLSTNIESK